MDEFYNLMKELHEEEEQQQFQEEEQVSKLPLNLRLDEILCQLKLNVFNNIKNFWNQYEDKVIHIFSLQKYIRELRKGDFTHFEKNNLDDVNFFKRHKNIECDVNYDMCRYLSHLELKLKFMSIKAKQLKRNYDRYYDNIVDDIISPY